MERSFDPWPQELTITSADTAQDALGGPAEACCEVFSTDADRVGRVRAAMPVDEIVDTTAALFRLVGHPTRVRLLLALAAGELCVCDLAQVLGASMSATSHQLRNLRAMGLVRFRTEGKLVYYRASDPVMMSLLRDGVAYARSRLASAERAHQR